ncbi:MAG TPA: hypothetical protein VKN18_32610 [Blastocatellia bacterium]|nr:hypothetical protein [Blastocatellia bacterium]
MYSSLLRLGAVMVMFLSTGLPEIRAQSSATRFEIGGQFSGIRADNSPGSTFFKGRPGDRLDVGGGGRFTFNLKRYVDLESELNFFREEEKFAAGATQVTFEGTKIEGVFGAKGGIRRDKFGVFGKLRPGFMHFNKDSDCPGCDIHGNYEFALDAGGVFEFYPSKRFLVRFDVGDTMIFLEEKRHIVEGFQQVFQNAQTVHKFQFSVGAGFRF